MLSFYQIILLYDKYPYANLPNIWYSGTRINSPSSKCKTRASTVGSTITVSPTFVCLHSGPIAITSNTFVVIAPAVLSSKIIPESVTFLAGFGRSIHKP